MRFMTLKEFNLIKDTTHFTRAEDRLGIMDFLKPRQKGGIFKFRSSFELALMVIFKTCGNIFNIFDEKLLQKLPTVKPNSIFKIIWDILIIFFVLMKMFIIPLELAFGIKMQTHVDSSFGLLNFITSCFFLFDIGLKMNTGYFEAGEMVLNKRLIVRHYFKSFFIMDILASVHSAKYIYEYNTYLQGLKPSSSVSFLHFFFFFKLVELAHVVTTLEEAVYMGRKLEFFYETIKLLVKVLLYNHLIACVWHAVAYYNHTTSTWIPFATLEEAEWFDRYLHAFFWSVCSLTSHHYGEKVSPQSRSELQTATLIILLSSGLFVFIIKDLGEILQNFLEKKNTHREKIKILNKFMKRKGISFNLQERARKYLNFYLTDMDNLHAKQEADILKTFSTSLREEIFTNTFGAILQKIPCIENSFSEDFKKKLIFSLKQVNFQPEEIIFQENINDDKNIYFVHDGKVDLLKGPPNVASTVCTLQNEETFGQKEFFSGAKREFTAKSMSFGTCFVLDRNEFMEILNGFPQDFEKFCMIRDKITIYKDFDIMYPRCYACGRKGHIYEECKRVHFLPDRHFLINKYQFSRPHISRKTFKRKRGGKFNTRGNLKKTTNEVTTYLEKASFLSSDESFMLEKEIEFDSNAGNLSSKKEIPLSPDKNEILNTHEDCHDESFLRAKYENIKENTHTPKGFKIMNKSSQDMEKEIEDQRDREKEKEPHINKHIMSFGSIALNKKFIEEEENKSSFLKQTKFNSNRDIELFRNRTISNTLSSNNNMAFLNNKKKTEETVGQIPETSFNKDSPSVRTKSQPNQEKVSQPNQMNQMSHFSQAQPNQATLPQQLAVAQEEEENELLLKSFQLYMFDFDSLGTFQTYFPGGNYETIIAKFKLWQCQKSHQRIRPSMKSFKEETLSPAQRAKLKRRTTLNNFNLNKT